MKIEFMILLFIFIVSCGIQNTKPSPVATLDEKVILYENINQMLGIDNRNASRLTAISYRKPEVGDITVTWVINDYGFQDTTKANAQIDATNILKTLQKNKTRFIYVILIGTFSTQDEYGDTTEIQALNLGFNKSKLNTINWDAFQAFDIYTLADVAKLADGWE